MIREVSNGEEIKPAEFVYRSTFMAMEHNYLCAVCRQEPAVLEAWWGVLQPCWACQKLGYRGIVREVKPDRLKEWRHGFLVTAGVVMGALLPRTGWAIIVGFVALSVHLLTLPEEVRK